MFAIASILTVIELLLVFFIRWQFKNDRARINALEQTQHLSPPQEKDLIRLRFRISLYKRRVSMLYVLMIFTGLIALVFGYIELTAEPFPSQQ